MDFTIQYAVLSKVIDKRREGFREFQNIWTKSIGATQSNKTRMVKL